MLGAGLNLPGAGGELWHIFYGVWGFLALIRASMALGKFLYMLDSCLGFFSLSKEQEMSWGKDGMCSVWGKFLERGSEPRATRGMRRPPGMLINPGGKARVSP